MDMTKEGSKDLEENRISVWLTLRFEGECTIWTGDHRLPITEIIYQCKNLLQKNGEEMQTDEELKKKVEVEIDKLIEKREKEKEIRVRVEEKTRLASEKGERVKLDDWMTDRCMNGHGRECSFDTAVEWVYPNGDIKIEYSCCY